MGPVIFSLASLYPLTTAPCPLPPVQSSQVCLMCVYPRCVRVHTNAGGGQGAGVRASWPLSLALGPVCIQDQKWVPQVSQPPVLHQGDGPGLTWQIPDGKGDHG